MILNDRKPRFQGHAIIRRWISQKRIKIDTWLLQITNRKWYDIGVAGRTCFKFLLHFCPFYSFFHCIITVSTPYNYSTVWCSVIWYCIRLLLFLASNWSSFICLVCFRGHVHGHCFAVAWRFHCVINDGWPAIRHAWVPIGTRRRLRLVVAVSPHCWPSTVVHGGPSV